MMAPAGQARDGREARELADIWSTQSRRHVSMGVACGCGMGGLTLQLAAYEQDIVDYVLADAEKQGRADVIAFLDEHGREDDEAPWRLLPLLAAIDEQAQAGSGDPEVRQFVLTRLGRTLRSFADMHR